MMPPAYPRMAFQTLCVATGSDCREAGHLDPVASARLSALVDVEIEASRTARVPIELRRLIAKMAKENPTWGEERLAIELLLKLGIRTRPGRSDIICVWRGAPTGTLISALGHVCSQPCTSHSRLRFLHQRDSRLSCPVRLRDHGSGHAQDRSLQRHRSSHRRVDLAAVPGGHHR